MVIIPVGRAFVALQAFVIAKIVADIGAHDVRGASIAALWLAAIRLGDVLFFTPAIQLTTQFGDRTLITVNRRIAVLVASVPTLEIHEDPSSQDRLSLLREPQAFGTALYNVVNLTSALAAIIVTCLMLITVSPILLIGPLLVLPGLWASARANDIVRRAEIATAPADRLATHVVDLGTHPNTNKELRVFGLEGWLRVRHRQAASTGRTQRRIAEREAAMVRLRADLITHIGFAAILLLTAWLVVDGRAAVSDVVLVAVLIGELAFRVRDVHDSFGNVQRHSRLLDAYVWLEGRVTDLAAHRPPNEGSAHPPELLTRGITFESVHFRYPGHDQDVLTGLDLHLPSGSVLALVGDNGAGKTTIAKLLSRFYEPTSGQILVDGIPLSNIDAEAWQGLCTACYQDFARLELVLRESVGVGDVAAIEYDNRLKDALRAAGSAQLEPSLTEGLDSHLGRRWGGVELSLGQWQRVALARSNMRAMPLLVLLDEPSASLDAETEHDLFQRTARSAHAATNGAVTMLISHRLTTIQMADHIAFIDEGRIVEHGTHDELMARAGRYATLYNLSASGYGKQDTDDVGA